MKQELEPIETIWMKKQKIMKHSIVNTYFEKGWFIQCHFTSDYLTEFISYKKQTNHPAGQRSQNYIKKKRIYFRLKINVESRKQLFGKCLSQWLVPKIWHFYYFLSPLPLLFTYTKIYIKENNDCLIPICEGVCDVIIYLLVTTMKNQEKDFAKKTMKICSQLFSTSAYIRIG